MNIIHIIHMNKCVQQQTYVINVNKYCKNYQNYLVFGNYFKSSVSNLQQPLTDCRIGNCYLGFYSIKQFCKYLRIYKVSVQQPSSEFASVLLLFSPNHRRLHLFSFRIHRQPATCERLPASCHDRGPENFRSGRRQ